MNDLARAVGQRNDRLHAQSAPLAYQLGDETLGLDTATPELVALDEDAMSATFCVASAVLDREGDVVNPAGIDVSHWSENPVWLWDHDTEQRPIGTGRGPNGEIGWQVKGTKAYATCWFHGETELSREVWGLVRRGVLKGTSIGFLGKSGKKVKTGLDGIDDPRVGWQFDTSELLEISLVCVPMNRQALREAKGLSLSLPPRRVLVAGWNRGKAMATEDEDLEYRTTAVDDPEDNPEGYEPEPVLGDGMGDMDPAGDEMGMDDMPDMDATEDVTAGEGPPGSETLQSMTGWLQQGIDSINDAMPRNENPKVKKALERLLADLTDAQEALDTLHGQEYGGGDENTPPPEPEPEAESESDEDTEEKGMDGDDESDTDDDEEKREKALTQWRGRLKRLGAWLDRTKGVRAGDLEEARRQEREAFTKRLARLEAAAFKAFGLKAV